MMCARKTGFSFSSLACAALCLLLSSCAEKMPPPSEKLELTPTSFSALDGWKEDAVLDAVPALRASCAVFEKKDPAFKLRLAEAGTIADWLAPCAELTNNPPQSHDQARAFFETYFSPYIANKGQEGLFTGYYQAQLHGSLQKDARYTTPLWGRPDDMLSIDLGEFRDSLKGQKITGKIQGTQFVPYDNRALIAQGSLEGRAKPLVWVDDPVSAFFLEVQGSGQVLLKDGTPLHIGYEAQNGHGYTPIGRVLAEQGEIERPVTMQKIRAWLEAHPERSQEIMNANPSVVFFRKQDRVGAVGAQNVVLTPLRSLAVDPSFVPLGVPLWLQTNEHRRIVIAQDTGGAIKGAVRGDLFWGIGPDAEAGAGPMQNRGTYFLLLPKKSGGQQ